LGARVVAGHEQELGVLGEWAGAWEEAAIDDAWWSAGAEDWYPGSG
jgi:hypothetical protein